MHSVHASMNASGTQRNMSPYENHGGSTLAIAGDDYALLAADTRQSVGYSIESRSSPKIFTLSATSAVACCGFRADALELVDAMQREVYLYASANAGRVLPTPALARSLSNKLYNRRFFPLYVHNLLAGIDPATGKGVVYSYDPVGSYEAYVCAAAGTAEPLLQPLLDCAVDRKNTTLEYASLFDPDDPHRPVTSAATSAAKAPPPRLPLEHAIQLARDAFSAATERDIYTGDSVTITIVTRNDGIKNLVYPLKRD